MDDNRIFLIEILKGGRIIGLLAVLMTTPFLYRELPLPLLLASLSAFLVTHQVLYFAFSRNLSIAKPLLHVQGLVYIFIISYIVHYSGGLNSSFFLFYALSLVYLSAAVKDTHLFLYFCGASLAFAGVTVTQWRNSPADIELLVQKIIMLFLISAVASVFNKVTARHARRTEKSKEDLLSTVSHELRAPLTSILGYVSLLLGAKAGPLNEKQKSFLQSVLQQGKKLESLISDILTAARPEVFLEEKEVIRFDLSRMVEDTVSKFQPVAEERELDLRADLPDDPFIIEGDPPKIEQVLVNLIDNSLKYTEKGEVTVTLEMKDFEVLVQVSDTGPGIAKEHVPYLFEKFYQVDGTLARAQGGTGLGLAIAQEIVLSRGGEIWVESEVGKGTTFFFTLPTRRVGESTMKVRKRAARVGSR